METFTGKNSNGRWQLGIHEPVPPTVRMDDRDLRFIPNESDVYNKTKNQEIVWWKKKLYQIWPG